VFIPEVDMVRMENHWDDVCRSQSNNSQPSCCAQVDTSNEEDGYEGNLRIPTSVLDGCEASFTAADAAREKASTQFFDDTALMALLCCHDHVLWIANMHSAGKKQHYALVLLEMLFQHLPRNFQLAFCMT
jgi:Kyakuja-Dileera-Zisupton transposase